MQFWGWNEYKYWLREDKERGRAILRPGWWHEGLEEFVDEDAPTLMDAILEAAEAQGITVAPHLLEATRLKNAPKPEAASQEEAGHEPEPEDALEETVPQHRDTPERRFP